MARKDRNAHSGRRDPQFRKSEDLATLSDQLPLFLGVAVFKGITDRRDAIEAAITMLARGDVLLVAGKGHEVGQVIGDEVIPFDDSEVVRSLIRGGI